MTGRCASAAVGEDVLCDQVRVVAVVLGERARVGQPADRPDAGAVDHVFGYTGREWDKDVGLQYNRARWYDPALGTWGTALRPFP